MFCFKAFLMSVRNAKVISQYLLLLVQFFWGQWSAPQAWGRVAGKLLVGKGSGGVG